MKEFFLDNDEQTDVKEQSHFRHQGTKMPPKGGDPAIEIYIRKFGVDLQQQLEVNQLKRCINNLMSDGRIALHILLQCRDVVIKPSDKKSAVVLSPKKNTSMKLSDNSITMPTTLNLMWTPPLRTQSKKSFIHYV